MKTAKKFVKSLSLKYQILLAMTLLCLFPFLGLLIYTIHDSLAAMQKQSLSNELEYLDKTRLQLETYKESAKSYFTSKAVEDVFFSYCYNDLDFRSYTMLHDAQEELENFSYGQDILEGAYFINFKNSFLISSGFAGDFLPNEEGDNPIQTLLLENDSHQTAMWAYLPPWEGFTRPGKYRSSGSLSAVSHKQPVCHGCLHRSSKNERVSWPFGHRKTDPDRQRRGYHPLQQQCG